MSKQVNPHPLTSQILLSNRRSDNQSQSNQHSSKRNSGGSIIFVSNLFIQMVGCYEIEYLVPDHQNYQPDNAEYNAFNDEARENLEVNHFLRC